MNRGRQVLARKKPNHDVDMIGHDAPRQEPVALFVKMTQGVCQFFSDRRISQAAGACAVVEELLDDRRRELLDFSALVGAQGAVQLICGCDDGTAFGLDAVQNLVGQRVCQPECDEVRGTFLFPVR